MEPGMVNCIQNVKVANKSCGKSKFTLCARKFWSAKIMRKLIIIYPRIPKNPKICGSEWGLLYSCQPILTGICSVSAIFTPLIPG